MQYCMKIKIEKIFSTKNLSNHSTSPHHINLAMVPMTSFIMLPIARTYWFSKPRGRLDHIHCVMSWERSKSLSKFPQHKVKRTLKPAQLFHSNKRHLLSELPGWWLQPSPWFWLRKPASLPKASTQVHFALLLLSSSCLQRSTDQHMTIFTSFLLKMVMGTTQGKNEHSGATPRPALSSQSLIPTSWNIKTALKSTRCDSQLMWLTSLS